MTRIVGVRFKSGGKVYDFDAGDWDLAMGDSVVVETTMGQELGFCTGSPVDKEPHSTHKKLKPILRKAKEEDLERYRENIIKAAHAMTVCKDMVDQHGLGMNLVESSYTLDGQKLLFFFTADGRVDFRELVRDLAGVFRTRIELRQVGIRDEAKLIGGIGPCGQELCCSRFLKEFDGVTIRMAKDQGLSLNPTNISGVCGRLMCCLSYEQEFYEEKLKEMPKVKQMVHTPEGVGKVIDVFPVKNEVRVLIETEDTKSFFTFSVDALSQGGTCPCPIKGRRQEVKEELAQRRNS
ncbi:MAG: stage 0 sporulation family protein [Tissierellia bacterium]|nr:stage 0 sporulation family protein [Tissierellia bacterium]